jgi:multicomponent Na+:H+ antiporter subunit F
VTIDAGGVLSVTVRGVLLLSTISIALALYRVTRGPTLPDRVVALDVIANLAVAVIAACAVAFDEPMLLQPALVIALIAFLGTVAFATHLERNGAERD